MWIPTYQIFRFLYTNQRTASIQVIRIQARHLPNSLSACRWFFRLILRTSKKVSFSSLIIVKFITYLKIQQKLKPKINVKIWRNHSFWFSFNLFIIILWYYFQLKPILFECEPHFLVLWKNVTFISIFFFMAVKS